MDKKQIAYALVKLDELINELPKSKCAYQNDAREFVMRAIDSLEKKIKDIEAKEPGEIN